MMTSATNRRLRVLLTELRDGKLIPDPAFQRRLVWSTRHKVDFIQTVLDGLPFPEIFIAAGQVNSDTGEGHELIVDGQQRLTTLNQYFIGSPDLKLGSALQPYLNLKEEQKIAFLEYVVVIRDLGSLTEEDTRQLFYKINSTSYGLNAMEVNNARFDGALKLFCDTLSTSDFFDNHRTFNSFDVKRMNDVKWCLTLVITMLSSYFNRDSEHESYLRQYNDEFPQEIVINQRLNRVLQYIDGLQLDSGYRAWQKSDLFTLIIELDKARSVLDSLDKAQVETQLKKFYQHVERAAAADPTEHDHMAIEYFAAARSGSNDRSSRLRRGDVISKVIQSS
jgi:hypothetical protein